MAEETTLDTGGEGGGGDVPQGGDSLRSDIERAFEQVEQQTHEPLSAPDKGAPAAPSSPAASPGERARGPDGRFIEGGAAKPPEKAPAAPAAAGRQPDLKTPAPAQQ